MGVFAIAIKIPTPPPYVPPESGEPDFLFDPQTYTPPEGDVADFIFT